MCIYIYIYLMYMCVYMYIYVYTYVYIYIYIYTSIYLSIYLSLSLYIYIYIYIYRYTHVYICRVRALTTRLLTKVQPTLSRCPMTLFLFGEFVFCLISWCHQGWMPFDSNPWVVHFFTDSILCYHNGFGPGVFGPKVTKSSRLTIRAQRILMRNI